MWATATALSHKIFVVHHCDVTETDSKCQIQRKDKGNLELRQRKYVPLTN